MTNPQRALRPRLLVALGAALLTGCLSNPAINDSRELLAAGQTDAAILRLADAVQKNPADNELRSAYHRQRELATSRLLADADNRRAVGNSDEAEALYRRVQRIDEHNPRAATGLAAINADRRRAALVREGEAALAKNVVLAERNARTVLAEAPGHPAARALLQAVQERQAQAEIRALTPKGPPPKPISMEFRDAQLKTVFEVLARSSGLNFVFDKDVKGDAKVTIFIRNSSVDEILRLILATNQLESKQLNENSHLIYPKTPAKAKEHQEMVVRSFFLANADTKQAQAMLKNVLKAKDLFIDEKIGLLVIKDTADVVKLAERLIESLDLAEPEVVLDVEVLEINRNQLYEIGLKFPDQIGYGLLQPTTSTTTVTDTSTQTTVNLGGTLAPGFVDLKNRSGLTSFVANPALVLNLKSLGGDSNLLANPRIRVRNREKAKIHIGDKLPIFTTTSTANVGVAASVSYLDVGLKLEVEPIVHLLDEVGMKVNLEVSSVVKEISGPSGSTAYQVGSRSATTSLRLKNGETQVLAGLIANEERNSANKLPGLGDVPLIGRLFASNRDSSSKTEIVLLSTPRSVRSLAPPQVAEPALAAGTETTVGAPAMRLSSTAPGSLRLSPRIGAGSGAAALPAPPVEEAAPATTPEPQAEPAPAVPPAPTPGPSTPAAVPAAIPAADAPPERPGELREAPPQ
ncbi:MAG: secretin and TonB N-terminal domain-containing protein [Sulfuritalea sp.]|nr:secretin and TonB N-terminal domain-containing protein [Sulfuritalea sp.]